MVLQSKLQKFTAKHADRFWPLSRKSLPSWSLLLSALTALLVRCVIRRNRSNVLAENAKKRGQILDLMGVMLEFVKDKAEKASQDSDDRLSNASTASTYTELMDLRGDIEEGLPESTKVLKLLWDPVLDVSTERFGIDPCDEHTIGIEALLRRVIANELRKVMQMTRQSSGMSLETIDAGQGSREVHGMKEAKDLSQYWNGDLLEKKLKFAQQVRRKLGHDFVEAKLLQSGWDLQRQVRCRQRRNVGKLLRLLVPALPASCLWLLTSTLAGALRAAFYTLGSWAKPLHAAMAGDMTGSRAHMARIFFGHVVIDYLNVLSAIFERRAMSIMGQNVKTSVMKALMGQDYEFFDRHSPGELQEWLNVDAEKLKGLIGLPISIFSTLIEIMCNMYGAYLSSPPQIFWMAVLPLFPVSICQHVVGKWKASIDNVQNRVREEQSGKMFEVLREVKTVRQFALEEHAVAEYTRGMEAQDDLSLYAMIRSTFSNILFSMSIYGGLVFTVALGVSKLRSGEMKEAQLLSVMFQLNFNVVFPTRDLLGKLPEANMLYDPILRISDLLDSVPNIEPKKGMMAYEVHSSSELNSLTMCLKTVEDGAFKDSRVVVSCDSPWSDVTIGSQLVSMASEGGSHVFVCDKASIRPDELVYPVRVCFSEKVCPLRFHGKIELDNVHFAYPTNPQKPVLKGVSLSVEPGEKVALVGMTGCGKSSIMSLLLRLYEPQQGKILIDGRPIEQYDVRYLRSRMVIVDQSTVLFRLTIRENIALGLGPHQMNDEEIQKVCEDACAWDFIQEQTDKLTTDLTTGGSNLSGGQRQRLAIARAMGRKPDIILLDEATSALDVKNESLVQKALDKLAKQGSALVIAHRLSTIKDSDQIVVLDQGVKQEQGTHDGLLRKAGDENLVVSSHGLAEHRTPPRSKSIDVFREPCTVLRRRLRSTSPQSRTALAAWRGGDAGVTYKSFWDASTKEGKEVLTLKQMQADLKKLRAELSTLEGRAAEITQHITAVFPEPAPAGWTVQ